MKKTPPSLIDGEEPELFSSRKIVCPDCHGPAIERRVNLLGESVKFIDCPKCGPDKEDREARRIAERHHRQKRSRRNEFAKAAMVPPRFFPSDISNFRVKSDAQRAVLRAAVKVIDDINDAFKTTGVILCGPVGVGKTHIGIAIMKAAINNIMSALYVSAPTMTRTIKSFWKKDKACDPLVEWIEPVVLFIDDVELASDEKNDSNRKIFDELIDRRWAKNKCTILATNQTVLELKEQIGRPAFDRLADFGVQINFPGAMPSYRTGQTAD